jgi:ligand-binding SRPBCC domain-containing protein
MTRLERPRLFVDERVRGAFARFTHTHEFHARDGGTLMIDRFDDASPLGALGRIADRLFLARYMTRLLEVGASALRRMAEAGSSPPPPSSRGPLPETPTS